MKGHLEDYKNCPKCGKRLHLDPYSAEWRCIAFGWGCDYVRPYVAIENGGKIKSC